jgi:hypothetical protein
MKPLSLALLVIVVTLCVTVTQASPLRGVKKSDEALYRAATFTCRDGSNGGQPLPASFINGNQSYTSAYH